MNRSKKLLVLLGLLLAACAATLAVMGTEARKEQIRNSGETILELPSESVEALSWEYGETALAFHRDEVWLYDGDENFPVSGEKINRLLEPFQSFGASFVIEGAEDLGQYGLDDPLCTIRLSTEAQDYEINLGDYSKMDSQRYVSIGDGNVYLVRHDPLDEFSAVLSDLIRHDEIPSFDHVTSITFAGAESYRIVREEDGAGSYSAEDIYFTQQGGRSLPLDTAKVEGYLRSVSHLDPADYVSYSAAEEDLQAYGLDAPALTITVEYTAEEGGGGEAAEPFVLSVSPDPEAAKAAGGTEDAGQEADSSAYIRIGTSQIIYRISAGNYKKLAAASYDDLRHSEVIWADFADIRQIDISLEGDSYTLSTEKDGNARAWLYQGEEFEPAGLRNCLEALTTDEFTNEQPTQREELCLTVHLDNEDFPQVQIRLYRYDGSHCLAAVDGESVSLVARSAVVDLIEAVHAVVLGQDGER